MKRLMIVLAILTVIASLCGGSALAAARSKARGKLGSFRVVARQAERAVVRGNWKALCRISAPQIVFAQYVRHFQFDIPDKTEKVMYPRVLFSYPKSSANRYNVEYLSVSTRKPLDRDARAAFRNFCGIVKASWSTENGVNEILLDDQGVEVTELRGPAVIGTEASNVHWRIELERHTGRWRVCRLVLMMH